MPRFTFLSESPGGSARSIELGPCTPIELDLGSPEIRSEWNVTTNVERICILPNVDWQRLEIAVSLGSKGAYLIHGAKAGDFAAIPEGVGTKIEHGAQFYVSFIGRSRRSAQASLAILEYGKDRKRSGTRLVTLGETQLYVPEPNVTYIVVAVRLSGRGQINISELLIYKHVSGRLEPEIETSIASPECRTSDHWRHRALSAEADIQSAHRRFSQPNAILLRDTLRKLAAEIPDSNGSRYFAAPIPKTIAVISDIYMFNFYKDACDEVAYLTPQNYLQKFREKSFDALIYVTCWKGIDNDEWRGILNGGSVTQAFDEILEICRTTGVVTIFQSIEDPKNYRHFLPIAKRMDYVFTSDIDMIDAYRRDCETENVFFGEYGFNPLINNPIGSRLHTIDAAFFAGSFPAKYPHRCNDMEMVFDKIVTSGGQLVIADRNFDQLSAAMRFPTRFEQHIVPPFDHALLQKVHKLFRYNLNFNSIQSSPTMCAMRVYELLAQGRTLWSNYARSIAEKFPDVAILEQGTTLVEILRDPENETVCRADLSRMRGILNDKASFEIVSLMLRNAGFDIAARSPGICLIVPDNSRDDAEGFVHNCRERTILVPEKQVTGEEQWKRLCAEQQIEYVFWLNPRLSYEASTVQDLINGFKFTMARYVSVPEIEFADPSFGSIAHNFTGSMAGRGRTMFAASEFAWAEIASFDQPRRLRGGYNIDPFNITTNCEKSS